MKTSKISTANMNGLKIAHTADTSRGATWMAEQLRELKNYGYSVTSIIPAEGELSQKLTLFEVPYKLQKIGFPWSSNQVSSGLLNIYRLAFLFYSQRYQIVHHHLYPSMIMSRFAAWIADVPVRVSMIPGPFYMDAEIPRNVELSCCWMDSRVIVSCQYSRQTYISGGVPAENIELVYYGADEKVFSLSAVDQKTARQRLIEELALEADCQLVGMVAYFYSPLGESDHYPKSVWNKSIKGHETLIDAIPQILAECPKARFLLIGDGWGESGVKLMKDIKATVAEKGLSDYVHFLGQRGNIPELLSTLSVSLQLSRSENLGGTIESLLMARPLIATRVGGMVDSVRHETTGLLVEMDNVKELSDSVCRLLRSPQLATQLGTSGQELMLREFSLSQTVKNLDEVYKRCFEDAGGKGHRMHVSIFRTIAAPFIFACLLAIQFRYEIEIKTGRHFSAAYAPVTRFQRDLNSAIKPLFSLGGNTSISALFRFFKRQIPVTNFWLQYPLVLERKRFEERVANRLRCPVKELSTRNLISVRGIMSICAELLTPRSLSRLIKRALDVTFASFLLIGFAPIFAAFWLRAKKEQNPMLERHTVRGQRNKLFKIYTFRKNQDPRDLTDRFTWLPMLINVLNGEMSIVGTRIRTYMPLIDQPENHATSWTSSPGLTGWCQLNMAQHHDFDDLNKLDILYMVNWNLLLDAKIVCKTALLMLNTRGWSLVSAYYWKAQNHQDTRKQRINSDLVSV